jgi:membrane protease YdiL (CAAX protease family)
VNALIESNQPVTTSRSLKQVLQEHPLFFFFLMAYGFSWIISIPYVLSVWGILPGDYTFMFIMKQWVGPALAGIIMTRIMEGDAGYQNLRQRVRFWHVGWQWYLLILFGIPALLLLGIIIQPGALADFKGLTPGLPVSLLVNFILIFIGVGLPEEIGWRGFALPRMQPRYGPLRGTLLLGVLWGFWHLLYFFTPGHGGGPGTGLAPLLKNFSIFLLMVVALTIIFTWLFNHTQGSVFIASLAHTAIDTPQLVWAPLFIAVGESNSISGETGIDLAGLITFGVLALLILILTHGKLGYQSDQELP